MYLKTPRVIRERPQKALSHLKNTITFAIVGETVTYILLEGSSLLLDSVFIIECVSRWLRLVEFKIN